MLLLGSDIDIQRRESAAGLDIDDDLLAELLIDENGEPCDIMENGGHGDSQEVTAYLFEQFCHASTCRAILHAFQALTDHVGLTHADHRNFYRKLRARITTWKANALWAKLDKRANHKEYRRGEACANTKVIIIGGGICGLRVAIETALLGARTVVVEKRDRFSRNNVLHLWPFLITDLKNLGAKKFYGKFCAGAIDHISIRQLQCILLKAALLVGVEVHVNVGFIDVIEPTTAGTGWRVRTEPEDHSLSEYEFDVLIGADGKRNTLEGFKRKEFRGKLAIAITANFINRNTQAEARVEEISGVAFIFNQKFFKDLNEEYGIDLENIVYYKDETHYFVMTAKKQSLMEKGVLLRDFNDTAMLLGRDNVDQDALANYAREAADFCTKHKMPHLDFAVNHYGRPDLAMFDFTSLFQAENSCRVVERQGKKLLMMLVGDSLLEPFWPTGSGCARGFLGAFDGAWMIKQWSSCKMTPLQVIAERESVYQLLSQTTPENLRQNFNQFMLDPSTRYTNMRSKWLKPKQVMHLYDTGENTLRDEVIEIPKPSSEDVIDTYSLLRWCQKILNTGKYHTINVTDLSTSWRNGLAFCALIHYFKPEAINYDSLNEADIVSNNQLAFDTAHKEFSINPVLTGEDMAKCERPDKLTLVSYLSQFYDLFKKQRPPSDDLLNSSFEENRKHRSPSHRISILQKLRSSRVSLSKLKKSMKKDKDEEGDRNLYNSSGLSGGRNANNNNNNIGKIDTSVFTRENPAEVRNGNVELTRFTAKLELDRIQSRLNEGNAKHEGPAHRVKESKLPLDHYTDRLNAEKQDELKGIKMREPMMPVVKVSKMAELLVSKFKNNQDQPPPEPLSRRVKGQPMMVASQPASEFCFFCKKRVYIMERMSVENVFFHSQCFKCEYCGIVLRTNTYAVDKTSYGDATRFFCHRHALPQNRLGRTPRKRVAPKDVPDVLSKDGQTIPAVTAAGGTPGEVGPTPTKVSAKDKPSSPKKTPEMLKPIKHELDDLTASLKTPERIEFEIEGLEEETEEEQWEHNMSMSLSRDGGLDEEMAVNGDDTDSDSDLEDLLSEIDEMDYEEVTHLLNVWSEDEEFQEAVDLYKSGRLEESLCLAKESLRRSTENLLEEGYNRLEENEEDTEVEDYDEEETSDSDTEMEDEPSSSQTTESNKPAASSKSRDLAASGTLKERDHDNISASINKNKSSNNSNLNKPNTASSVTNSVSVSNRSMDSVPSPVLSARSPSASATAVKANRNNFFSTPPEPVRLDPFKMFGMARQNPVPAPVEEVKKEASPGATSDKVPTSGVVEDAESDEATDSQVASALLDNKADGRLESNNTDDDMDEAFVSAEYGHVNDDDEKTAVSRAMELLLEDMDHRSASASDSAEGEHGKESSGEEGEDDVFTEYRKRLTSLDSMGSHSESEPNSASSRSKSRNTLSSSENYSKSGSRKDSSLTSSSSNKTGGSNKTGELGATEKSVLRSVQQMSDNSNSTAGSGDTTMQVLKSVSETVESSDDKPVEHCVQYLDDRFVTKRSRASSGGRLREKSKCLKKTDSSDSITLSTPSQSSRHTSNSDLSEEYEYNKAIFDANESDDERPDSQLLRDYQLTLSQALSEEELHSPDDSSNLKMEEDLDQTLNAEEAEVASPRSEYLSPRSEPEDVSDKSEYVSPKSERTSSVYGTPESSLNDQSALDVKNISDSAVNSEKRDSAIGTKRKTSVPTSLSKPDSPGKGFFGFELGKKKKTGSIKPLKTIKSDTDIVNTPLMPVKSGTIVRPYSNRSREGSVESNPLEKDAWGDSSSCSSLNSVKENETSQKTWRPLPPLPTESKFSPQQSKTVSKTGTGRKLPNPDQANAKSPVVFQSNFMKKAYVSNTDSGESSNSKSMSPVEIRKPVITTQPRPLPPTPDVGLPPKGDPTKASVSNKTSDQSKLKPTTQNKTSGDLLNSSSGAKTKIAVDYSKLALDKDSGSETDKKKKRIPVATALKKSVKPTLSNTSNSAVEEQSDDIPFADDSDDGGVVEEKFFTPSTSIKPKRKAVRRDGEASDARKRLLPTPPKADGGMLSADKIRDIRKGEIEKARQEARDRARLKSDEELGLRETPYGKKYQRTVSTESSNYASATDRVSDSEDLKSPVDNVTVTFTPDIPALNGTPKSKTKKKKKTKSREGSLSSQENFDLDSKKDKKKRSLFASILSGVKTPQKDLKDKDRSSSNDTLEEKSTKKKKTKTPKTDKKKKEKKRKTLSVDDTLLENMSDLKIGAVFMDSKNGKRQGLKGRIGAPKASMDDFTDSDEDLSSMATSCTSLNESFARRTKSDNGPLTEEELNARITRKIQHAARKQQKQQEQKRMRQAQEIQRKLQEVDVKQRELEERGVNVERALRGEGPEGGRSESELMQEWFNLVHDKNALVRLESELMVSARELELEDRQGRLQQQLRESMSLDDTFKSPMQREREQRIYSELIEVVEERDKLVAMLEDERLREQEEDKDLENVMKAKGFSLTPTTGSKILRKHRTSKSSAA